MQRPVSLVRKNEPHSTAPTEWHLKKTWKEGVALEKYAHWYKAGTNA